MGSFWIWILVSIVFGITCSILFQWCDKDNSPHNNGRIIKKYFIENLITFTAIGIIIILILSIIFAG